MTVSVSWIGVVVAPPPDWMRLGLTLERAGTSVFRRGTGEASGAETCPPDKEEAGHPLGRRPFDVLSQAREALITSS